MTPQSAPFLLSRIGLRAAPVLATAFALTLALTACSRSPKEQLAFQHAEEQYQINQRNTELARSRPDSDTPAYVQNERGRERD